MLKHENENLDTKTNLLGHTKRLSKKLLVYLCQFIQEKLKLTVLTALFSSTSANFLGKVFTLTLKVKSTVKTERRVRERERE